MADIYDVIETPEFWGRVERMRENAVSEGREFFDEEVLAPDSDFITRYLELEEVLNDRDLWASDQWWDEVYDFLREFDLIPEDVDYWSYIIE